MKNRICSIILASAILVGMTMAPAFAKLDEEEKNRVGAELILWFPTVTGNLSFDNAFIDGTDLDIVDMLNLDENATDFELGLWLNITKRNRLSFFWFMDQRSGSTKLEESIEVDGKKYVVGGEVKTDVDLQRYKLLYERSLFRNDMFRIALLVGASYFDATAKIKGVALKGIYELSDSEDKRVQFILPVIGLAAEVHLPLGFGLFAEGCGMGLGYTHANGKYFDVRGGVNWKSRFVFAQAGYQYIELSVDAFDALVVEYSLGGPFVSAGVKF